MLKRHHEIFQRLFLVADMVFVAAAWLLAYSLRFHWGPIEAPLGTPPLANYLPMTLFVWVIWPPVLRAFGLYHVSRSTSSLKIIVRLTQAASLAALITMAVAFSLLGKTVLVLARCVRLLLGAGRLSARGRAADAPAGPRVLPGTGLQPPPYADRRGRGSSAARSLGRSDGIRGSASKCGAFSESGRRRSAT